MKTQDYKDGKLVTLSNAFDSRAKALYFFYFLVFFTAATIFMRIYLTATDPPVAIVVVTALGAMAFYLGAYRFINKALMSEKLFVNKNSLQLIKQGLFGSLVKSYHISDISNFRHLKKPELSAHPLAGQSFDYLGFQTEQKVISEMHGDNRIAFDWKGIPVVFGQDIYSWDFESLEMLLYDVTGNDFRYNDELKKTFGSDE
jgi:hypothetical protein